MANFPVHFCKDNKLPIVPYGVLAKLIVLHYHDKHHREADTIVTFVRNDVWPVKARKIASGWDMEQLVRFGATKGLEWKTAMANAQHQNGASEAMVKMAKGIMKTMMKVLGDTKLSLNELYTVLAEVTNLVNERPIGIQPTDQAATDYLSPNSLLLGRSSDRICSGPFESNQVFTDDPNAVKTRFLLVQALVSQFWKVWLKLYFPTLLIRRKWHLDRRNLCVGDICLMKDSNAFRGEWRLCEVNKTFPDAKKKVRNVQLRLKPRQGSSTKYVPTVDVTVKRHVGDLIVLVPVEEREDVQPSQNEDR